VVLVIELVQLFGGGWTPAEAEHPSALERAVSHFNILRKLFVCRSAKTAKSG